MRPPAPLIAPFRAGLLAEPVGEGVRRVHVLGQQARLLHPFDKALPAVGVLESGH